MSEPALREGGSTPAGAPVRAPDARLPLAPGVVVGLDAACVLAFVVAGQVSHDSFPSDVLAVAAPFLAAGAVAHVAVRRRRHRLWPGGVIVWLGTWAGGMAVRGIVHDGVAPTFVAVGLGVLGVLLLGWRAAGQLVRRRPSKS